MADRIMFGRAMRKGYIKSKEAAEAHTKEYAERFKADWQARFGNDDLIAGPGGVPGTAEPIAPSTLAARIKRGWYGTGALYDPSLPHVSEGEGTIKDSITIAGQQKRERGFYTESWNAVYTTHPKFPLNEWGYVVPIRQTLRPTEEAIGPEYARELIKEYENILMSRENLL